MRRETKKERKVGRVKKAGRKEKRKNEHMRRRRNVYDYYVVHMHIHLSTIDYILKFYYIFSRVIML